MKLQEDLIKAVHSIMFAVGSLQDALRGAGPVESIVLLGLIEDAAKLQQRIEAIHVASGGWYVSRPVPPEVPVGVPEVEVPAKSLWQLSEVAEKIFNDFMFRLSKRGDGKYWMVDIKDGNSTPKLIVEKQDGGKWMVSTDDGLVLTSYDRSRRRAVDMASFRLANILAEKQRPSA